MKKILIGEKKIDVDLVRNLAYGTPETVQVSLSEGSKKALALSRSMVDEIVRKDEVVYGITTGFGALSNKKISTENLSQLQYNLIRSHCTGVGEAFSKEVVRALIFIRIHCLSQGYSGISPEIVDLMISFLNNDIIPLIPRRGSVGASGDLAPLAHLALTLIGEGEVFYKGQLQTTSSVLSLLGLKPAKLRAKDGLALINGTSVMAALGSLAVSDAKYLAKIADLSAAMTLEALRGTKKAYDPRIANLKPHPGQIIATSNLNKALQGDSEIAQSHLDCDKVQDPYSLRCVPQVHGACRQTISHAEEVINCEINSVTDNPLVFINDNDIVSGGNFHGEAIALAMDYLCMGLSELSNIAERRVEKLMNNSFSDLPPFLIKDSGLNSGLMIAQVTMAALVSESKTQCFPCSVDSIPTSTDKEDHVSMGINSGNKLLRVLNNVKYCFAIEFLCNSQAIDFLRPLKSTELIEKTHSIIRSVSPTISVDRQLNLDIEVIKNLIESRLILQENILQ